MTDVSLVLGPRLFQPVVSVLITFRNLQSAIGSLIRLIRNPFGEVSFLAKKCC